VPGTDAFGEQKPRGLLARLFAPRGSPGIRTTVRRSESLSLEVPNDRVEAVQAAVDEWLRGHGITAGTTVEPKVNGKSRIHAKLGQDDAARLDLAAERIQSELQDVVATAIH
jgi:hypothetical protein